MASVKRLALKALYPAVYYSGARVHDGGLTILSYHALDTHPTAISVPPRLFAAHMAALAAAGCVSLTMGQVAAHLAARRPFPRRAVAITFDDGFASVASAGGPILRRYGLTATIYVITGMIGRVTHWSAGGQALPSAPILDWAQIRALQDLGMEIGAHTISHPFLTRCRPAEARKELAGARAMLEAALARPVRAFAYPQGDYDPAVVAATRAAGYTTAVTLDQGRARPGADPLLLPRLHVGRHTPPAALRAFVVPTIGPTYRLINFVIRGMLGRRTWPRPDPRTTQSTATLPAPLAP
jgi:peptidoglycan/xylan/chitin deacetylase (PgdA/CDA1 family)